MSWQYCNALYYYYVNTDSYIYHFSFYILIYSTVRCYILYHITRTYKYNISTITIYNCKYKCNISYMWSSTTLNIVSNLLFFQEHIKLFEVNVMLNGSLIFKKMFAHKSMSKMFDPSSTSHFNFGWFNKWNQVRRYANGQLFIC